jgi:hypothetical protein
MVRLYLVQEQLAPSASSTNALLREWRPAARIETGLDHDNTKA